jgi:hypothetical protein
MITSAFSMVKIYDASLSVRARNVLLKAQIYTLADLIEFVADNGPAALTSIKNFGQTTFTEVSCFLFLYFNFNICDMVCDSCQLPSMKFDDRCICEYCRSSFEFEL